MPKRPAAKQRPTPRPKSPTRFPLKGNGYFLGCDGALQMDGTYSIRVLISGIKTQDDARKAAKWLQGLIAAQIPKGFSWENGDGND